MKGLYTALVASAITGAFAAPTPTDQDVKPRAAAAACASAVTLTGNPFTAKSQVANKDYSEKVKAAAAQMSTNQAAALKVADVPTFLWIDRIAAIELIEPNLKDIPCDKLAAFVIYDLPGRDCAAKASNGELPAGDLATYKSKYIDPIVAIFKKYPNTGIVLVIEPDSLPNLVTNKDLQTCKDSADGYKKGVAYAFKSLNLPNIAMYVDAGHGGWLGWNDNLKPGAQMLASVYKDAGSPKQVRGFATNVAGWNSWDLSPGEFSKKTDAQWNKAQNEKQYVDLFSPALKTAGFPAQAIVDTGRNGVTGLREEWGNWCNVKGAGFGRRPTSSTSHTLTDAFVWVKPGGESDGTSDESADRYDSFCGKTESFKPAPEAGQWNQQYFEELVANANPKF
ncbi:glycoside hydrolase family 6 protein [Amniculicola lignicola CBS 123094]|uniref:Glucanase n=1 Tax=Amniculicola lignicola CBS 123094 TaxID=1392246 RepID=A0A6A5WRA9_9PLEO|nr:glycoside hydrolase family 6 protein [Amniculicola lignicola CBS 123094]